MKNIIITGSSSGLGLETAKILAQNPENRIILACRNSEKAEKTKNEITAQTGNENVIRMTLDTSSLESVKSFADRFISEYRICDVLINNAGISPMHSGTTEDGFELVFETNYLGHFLLTNLLLPAMSENGRIISVVSDMHNPPAGIKWVSTEFIAHPRENNMQKYSFSKLCLILFTHKLNEILKDNLSGICANTFNPGYMQHTAFSGGKTDDAYSLKVKQTMPERYGELPTSSAALAEIAQSEEYDGVTNEYFDRSTNTAKSSDLSYDEEIAGELWNDSLSYCKKYLS